MTEREFDFFCKHKFDTPDFLLGRKRKKDATECTFDYYAGVNSAKVDDGISKIDDISDLLTDLGEGKVLSIKRPRDLVIKDDNRSNSTNTKGLPLQPARLWVDKYAPTC